MDGNLEILVKAIDSLPRKIYFLINVTYNFRESKSYGISPSVSKKSIYLVISLALHYWVELWVEQKLMGANSFMFSNK